MSWAYYVMSQQHYANYSKLLETLEWGKLIKPSLKLNCNVLLYPTRKKQQGNNSITCTYYIFPGLKFLSDKAAHGGHRDNSKRTEKDNTPCGPQIIVSPRVPDFALNSPLPLFRSCREKLG